MKNTFQKKLYENGYLIIKNVLNFERDLKPVLNDMEFVMDCLIQKYTKRKEIKKVLNLNFKRKIESQYSNVYCVLANKNLGYGKGNNLGLSMVKTRFALILNPDAQLKNDTLDKFLITAENMRDFAIIGPGIQEAKDTLEKKYNQKDIIETDNVKGLLCF